MNSRLTWLAGLFAAQLLLVALFSLSGGSTDAGEGLLTLDPSSVTGLEISDADGAAVQLTRDAEGWLLEAGVEADDAKVAELLDKLAATDGLWPVAATAGSQTRFEVAEDNYQRRLELTVDGEAVRVYFGTSPGYRRVHARRDGADEVFAVALANYELPVSAGDWLDKTQLASNGVNRVTLDDAWTLADGEEGWLLNGDAAAQDAAARLAERLDGLRVLGSYTGDEAGLEAPRRMTLLDAEGELELTFRHRTEEDDYVLTSSRLPGAYTVAAYIVEQLLVDADSLRPQPELAPGDGQAGEAMELELPEADASEDA